METVAGFFRFIILNGATLLAALGFASRLQLESRAQRLLAACVLFVGISNATALALGLLGQLRYGPVLALQVGFALAGVAFGRRDVMRDLVDPRPLLPLFQGSAERAALVLLALAYGYALFLGIVSETFAGDELMYHLPLVAGYARDGAIEIPELGRYWCNKYWAFYPGGAYLLYLWFVLPFGNGFLVDLVQFPYAFATALACYVLARTLGARRRDAVWAAILFLAVPIVINQVKTALVDVTLSFLFASGFAFLLMRPLTPAALLVAAIAWGAAPGVKLPALLYLALGFTCVALYHLDRERSLGRALRLLVPAGAALALGLVVLSGYWFARNAWLTGSPIYPLNLSPEPPKSWSNILLYGVLFPLLDFSPRTPDLFNYETGAGPQFIGLAVPALIAFGVAAARERRLGGIVFALLPMLAYGVWLVRLSTSVQTLLRYVVPAMPLGFAAFAWLMGRLPRRAWMTGLALVCIAFSVFTTVPRLGTYTNAESLRVGLAKWRRGEARQRFDVMGAVDLQDYRRAWAFLGDLPGSHDIAASHLIFTYPMMGEDFRHRLHFLDTTTPEQWFEDLRARRVEYVALAEFTDTTGRLGLGHNVSMALEFEPAGDEYFLVARRVPPQKIQALRIRYHSVAAENGRLLVGVNRFARVWDLPLPSDGEHTEVLPWRGEVGELSFVLDYVPRTSLRAPIQAAIESLDVQDEQGEWTSLPHRDYGAWEVLRWPLEYYWIEAHPERFKLVMRDTDFWRSQYSGEMRIYRVLPGVEADAAR